MDTKVAVIGGGYAGLSAAVELARAGVDVTVFEASRTLGGRARVVEKDEWRVDNGQHILVGAYTETLRLLRFLKVSPKTLLRRPFFIHVPERLDLRAAELPAPFHLAVALLRAKGLSWADRLAMQRLLSDLKKRKFTFEEDITVGQLLRDTRQTHTTTKLIWDPLCVAALNTPTDEASAQVFANVLRDTLAGGAAASEMLIPRQDLTNLLPFPATLYLNSQGHAVHTASPIKGIRQLEDGRFLLEGDPFEAWYYTHVILAVAPYHASELLAGHDELSMLREQIDALPYEPITTVYLAYDASVRLPEPMLGVADSVLQWLFDRGQLGGPAGLLAGVISARGPHSLLPKEELALRAHETVEKMLARDFPRLGAPRWSQVITEKRATFACRPDVIRPIMLTPKKNLLLAGDYVASPYPATIEAAVRSGLNAARHVLRVSRADAQG